MSLRNAILAGALAILLGGCSAAVVPGVKTLTAAPAKTTAVSNAAVVPGDLNGLIAKYAALYDVPESLIHRVIVRESGYNPRARNGPYYGLMQIRYDTAMTMGYRGTASGLLDADTNLRYGVKYLSGAYRVAGFDPDGAVRGYSRGYYYDAKRLGLLEEVGLR